MRWRLECLRCPEDLVQEDRLTEGLTRRKRLP
jgi:hypothetical protein